VTFDGDLHQCCLVAAQGKRCVSYAHRQRILTGEAVGNHPHRFTWQKSNFQQAQCHPSVFLIGRNRQPYDLCRDVATKLI
jgi:hypothetical protein